MIVAPRSRQPVRTAAVALLVLALPLTASARDLLRDGGTVVSRDDGACAAEMRVTVTSASADLFASDDPRMQQLADAARAMLRYECDVLERLQVRGRLRGVDTPVFEAVAAEADGWRLAARRSVAADTVPGDAASVERAIRVASVSLDMSPPAVQHNLGEVFGEEPVYDAARGVVQLPRDGCEMMADHADGSGYQPPSANCVSAWFDAGDAPAMVRFRYTQSASGSIDEVREVLLENFGSPRADGWNPAGGYHAMRWTSPPSADGQVTEALEARLVEDHGETLIDIVLSDPRKPVPSGERRPKLTL